ALRHAGKSRRDQRATRCGRPPDGLREVRRRAAARREGRQHHLPRQVEPRSDQERHPRRRPVRRDRHEPAHRGAAQVMKRPYAMLAATGHAVPKRAFHNDEFASIGVETSDEWIRERTGIRQRYISGEGETLTSVSSEAARTAMARAGVTAAELDAIILGTASPDRLLPSTAVEIQAALGATRAVAFDIDAACSG